MDYVEVKGGDVDREGAFRIAPVYPGKFRVHVSGLPENAFVKSVQVDGGAPGDEEIDLSRGVAGSKLKITVGLNGGQIGGTLSVEGGDSSPVRRATIVLAATPGDDIGSRYSMGVAAGKKYRLTGLRPGKYRFIVVDSTQLFETERLQAMFATSPEIEVHEGDRITRDVKIAAKEKPRGNP